MRRQTQPGTPSPSTAGPRARRLPLPALIAAAAPLFGLPALTTARQAAPDAPSAEAIPPASPTREAELFSLLRDPAALRRDRETAAAELIDMDRNREVASGLRDLLTGPSDPSGARDVLASALAKRPIAPVSLFRPFAAAVREADAERLPNFLAALGSFRTREAAELLVEHAAPDRPAPVRSAAAAALARLSGRDDLGADHAAWQDWFASVRTLSETEWRGVLAAGLAARSDRLDAARAGASAELIEVYRALYLARPAEERGRIIAHLLLKDAADLQNLGFEILGRELSAGARSIDGAVSDAAVRLLSSPRASVRARAAAVLNQLAPQGVKTDVLAALQRETDPDAAASLLLAAARWPLEDALAPALRWLESGGAARAPAIDMLLVLYRSSLLEDSADRERIVATLRELDAASIRPSGLRLLAAIGSDADRERIAQLLNHEAASVRLAAADALADRPEAVDLILAAAARDPGLFDAAARAIGAHRPTAVGYRELAAIDAATPETRRDGLLAAADRLPAAELIAVAREMRPDSTLREASLSRLASRPLPANADEDQLISVSEGLLLLAETRLAHGRPEGALAALDAVPLGAYEPERTAALATVALLWTNRPAQAAEYAAPASVWLDGLERALEESHAPEIARVVADRFGADMTPEESERLRTLRERIAQLHPIDEDEGFVGPPEPPR